MVKRLCLLALLLASACTFPEEPLTGALSRYVVHGVLDPSRRFQVISLTASNASGLTLPMLDSAAVVVSTPDGRKLIAVQQGADATGLRGVGAEYRIDLQGEGVELVPGATYSLHIVTRRGDTITAQTTLPSVAVSPATGPADFRKATDTLSLAWPRAVGARSFQVQIWSSFNQVGNTFASLQYRSFADTVLTLAGTAKSITNDEVFVAEATSDVYVYAVDDNYYEYYRLFTDPFAAGAPTRLTGGLGFFGSVVPVIRKRLSVR